MKHSLKQDERCGVGATLLRVPNFIFRASCAKHDSYYDEGGGLVEKVYADVMFWAYMIEDVKKGSFGFWRKYMYFTITVVYFIGVSVLGLLLFKWRR